MYASDGGDPVPD